MSDGDSFLQTIIENPREDLPRLVYADWLEEYGDPRGEFIRIQCALSQMEIDDERRPELIGREKDLLIQHGDAWAGKLKSMVKGYCFRRGFIDWVTLPGRQFLKTADELFDLAPLCDLRLTHLGMGNFPAAELASVKFLSCLNGLELAGSAQDERIRTILDSPHVKQISRLQLDEVRCAEQTLQTIFGGSFPQLRALELVGDEFAHFASIVCRPRMVLHEYSIKASSGSVIRDGVVTLARAKNLDRLTFLDLRNNSVQVPGATALAESKVLTKLQVLGLKGCDIGVRGMQALGQSANFGDLRGLNLEMNHFGINGLRAFVGGSWPKLMSLNLANNDLDDRVMPLLVAWDGLSRLRYLDVSGNDFSDDAMAEFLSAPALSNLWKLNLGGRPSDIKTMALLKDNPRLDAIQSPFGPDYGFNRFNRQPKAHLGTRMNIH